MSLKNGESWSQSLEEVLRKIGFTTFRFTLLGLYLEPAEKENPSGLAVVSFLVTGYEGAVLALAEQLAWFPVDRLPSAINMAQLSTIEDAQHFTGSVFLR